MNKTLILFRSTLLKSRNDFGKQHPTLARTSYRTHNRCMKTNWNIAKEESATEIKLILMISSIFLNEKTKIRNIILIIPGEVNLNTFGRTDKATKNLS